ncbi:EF hand/EF-hand domain pair [Rubellimicrobium thermophilum DSM 16684]|uniref:EF hand/EF-hand domain pair n=1 Tax=Rubellimicrobium thermophilum DSM 16684 TaxID=1123069 RepID=S9R5M9_9RHOB|nr:EF hand/EF-hand domain pair [Rubellimicrobium thermophilum]EPX87293.1 EF hand/EF-hand domain pair [Rubellimicrobium thermophilum DSM 16684]
MRRTMITAALMALGLGGAAMAQDAPAETPLADAPAGEAMGPMAGPGWMGHPGGRRGFGRGGPFGHGDGWGPGDLPNMAPLAHEFYDTDGDGRITREEIEARKAQRFAEADANGDGALSPEELVALEEAIRQEMRLARATRQIARMDDNGDGLLQAEELEERTPRLAPIFDRLDADGDGALTVEELGAGRPGRSGG